MKLYGIAAIGKDRQIGLNGKLPWQNYEELQHFKKSTEGHIIIMGRKTHESIGKPLKNRKTIVISKNMKEEGNDMYTVDSPTKALALATFVRSVNQSVYICGGESIYKYFLPQFDKLIISRMDYDGQSDVQFPEFEEGYECTEMTINRRGNFNVETWERIK